MTRQKSEANEDLYEAKAKLIEAEAVAKVGRGGGGGGGGGVCVPVSVGEKEGGREVGLPAGSTGPRRHGRPPGILRRRRRRHARWRAGGLAAAGDARQQTVQARARDDDGSHDNGWQADIAAADDAKQRLQDEKEEEAKAKTRLRLLQDELDQVMNMIINEQVPPPQPLRARTRAAREF